MYGQNIALSGRQGYGDAGGDPSLTLDYNFLLNSGTAITSVAVKGPVPTFTRASDAGSFISTGLFALVGGNDLPRFAHDPADSNAKLGLLMEEARTQLGHKTSDLADAVWTTLAVNADVPSSAEDDIFGTSLGSELACTATADQAVSLAQAYTGLTANTTTAVAIHVKTGTNASFVQLAWDDAGGGADGCFCNFELTGAGTAGTPTALAAGDVVSADIQLTTNGFYRCSLVGDIDVGTTARFTISIVDRIDAAVFEAADLTDNDSLIVDAIDVQVGEFITSHIPNSGGAGTSVTRAKDILTTTDVDLLDETQGTFVYQVSIPILANIADQANLFLASDNSGNNRIKVFSPSGTAALQYKVGGSNTLTPIAGSWNAGVNIGAFAYAEDDAAHSLNGGAVVIDTDGAVMAPGTITDLDIGHNQSNSGHWDNYIQILIYYNVRKPNAFLVSETT